MLVLHLLLHLHSLQSLLELPLHLLLGLELLLLHCSSAGRKLIEHSLHIFHFFVTLCQLLLKFTILVQVLASIIHVSISEVDHTEFLCRPVAPRA